MKYYKITNEEEIHNGLQYQDGLIEDIMEFNPHGNCAPGGIYFAREDIFAFLDYGPWIREVSLPDDARVYENPGSLKKWKADKVVLGPRRRIDLEVIKELVEAGAEIHGALRWAAENGHLEVVKYLVEAGADIHVFDGALRSAAIKGHLEVVKYLVEAGAEIHGAVSWAALRGHLEVVKYLKSI